MADVGGKNISNADRKRIEAQSFIKSRIGDKIKNLAGVAIPDQVRYLQRLKALLKTEKLPQKAK